MLEHWTSEDFLNQDLPDDRFIVDPLLTIGGDSLLYGRGGLGKSLLAMTLARDIINGQPFLDRYTTHRGRVLYISADMTRQTLIDRLGRVFPYLHEPDNLHFLFTKGNFDCLELSADLPEIKAAVDFGADLVVLDTLRNLHFLSENDSESAAKVYGAWRALFGEHPHMLYLHHDRKSYGDDFEAYASVRGSLAWLNAVDTGLLLSPTKGPQRLLTFSKTRDSEDQAPVILDVDPDTLTLRAAKPTPAQVAHIMAHDGVERTKQEFVTELRKRTDCSQATAYRCAEEFSQNS